MPSAKFCSCAAFDFVFDFRRGEARDALTSMILSCKCMYANCNHLWLKGVCVCVELCIVLHIVLFLFREIFHGIFRIVRERKRAHVLAFTLHLRACKTYSTYKYEILNYSDSEAGGTFDVLPSTACRSVLCKIYARMYIFILCRSLCPIYVSEMPAHPIRSESVRPAGSDIYDRIIYWRIEIIDMKVPN